MRIVKLEAAALTRSIFKQMVDIEVNCGIFFYPPDVLYQTICCYDTYLLMDTDKVAGFITMDPDASDYFDTSLHIVNVNVAAPYRRQGLAQRMIRTVCKCYAASHAKLMVSLDVQKTNTPALSLYRKLGFVITDIPSESGDTDWVMAIPLAQLIE